LDVKRRLNPGSVPAPIPAAVAIGEDDTRSIDVDVDVAHSTAAESLDADDIPTPQVPNVPSTVETVPSEQSRDISMDIDTPAASGVRRSERVRIQAELVASLLVASTPTPKQKPKKKHQSRKAKKTDEPEPEPHEIWMEAARQAGLVVEVGDTAHPRLIQRCPACYNKPASEWGGQFKE
jgi:hypothetical protein